MVLEPQGEDAEKRKTTCASGQVAARRLISMDFDNLAVQETTIVG